ncbi:MAG: NlpC/P60 family protein [bacterium]|nr:NlpC/P60 family protein [bacterium]
MNKNWIKYLTVSFCILQAAPITSMAAGNQAVIQLFTRETGATLETKAGLSYDKVAISHVTNYVNVRAEANTNSSIVGKIYNNCAALILSSVNAEDGLWYQIESGNVTGYIKAEYFITGAEAEQLAKKVGTEFAKIKNATTLRLREKPSLDSKTLTLLAEGAEYVVEAEEGDFVKICVDTDLTGYVSKDYIETWIVFDTAVTLEEEKERQEESEKRKKEADEAIRQLEEIKQIEAANPLGTAEQTENGMEGTVVIPGGSSQSSGTAGNGSTGSAGSGNTANAGNAGTGTGNSSAASSSGGQTGAAQIQAPGSNTEQSGVITIQPGGSQNNTSSGTGSLVPGGPEGSTSANSTGNTGSTNNTNTAGNTGNSGTESSSLVSGGPNSSQNAGTAATADKEKVETATRTAIVAYAKQFLGNPYVYGGTSLTNGADCSGFVQSIFAHFGITTGRSSRDQAAKGTTIAVSDVQPGDLLFYASGDYINHVAIYIGGNQVIHASNSRTGIIISPANYRTPYKAVTFLK